MRSAPSGSVYSIKLHLVLVTKYRYKVINDEIHLRLKEIIESTCEKWECECLEFNSELDHAHVLLDINLKVAPAKLINNLKTVSSRLIRKGFAEYLAKYYRKPVLWSIGYAVNSCGAAPLEKVKDYIKNQDRQTQASLFTNDQSIANESQYSFEVFDRSSQPFSFGKNK